MQRRWDLSGVARMPAESRPYVDKTGASGKIGSALARALSRDYAVIRLDRSPR